MRERRENEPMRRENGDAGIADARIADAGIADAGITDAGDALRRCHKRGIRDLRSSQDARRTQTRA